MVNGVSYPYFELMCFCRPKDEIIDKLKPYFEVDYLLPRTLMASLKLEQIHSVVTSIFIPPEISLASSFYYLKKDADLVSI